VKFLGLLPWMEGKTIGEGSPRKSCLKKILSMPLGRKWGEEVGRCSDAAKVEKGRCFPDVGAFEGGPEKEGARQHLGTIPAHGKKKKKKKKHLVAEEHWGRKEARERGGQERKKKGGPKCGGTLR